MRKIVVSLVFAASLLLAGCEKGQVIAAPTVVEPSPPVSTVQLPTQEPTQQLQVTPVAVFGQVGYIPGAFPTLGGENWIFTDMASLSCRGSVDTRVVKQEGFTPLSEGGCVVSILAEGAKATTFYLVPRLDQAQYYRSDQSVGVAKYNPDVSEVLVPVYTEGNQVIYRQPGVMADFRDGTVPLLGREDATGDVWVLYVGNDGSIVRRASAFFGSQDTVQVVDGKVLVNGENMLVSESNWVDILPPGYKQVESGWIVDLFPEARVYSTDRGDVVVINDQTDLRLAGQTIQSQYGSFTFLVGDSHYQTLVSNLLSEEGAKAETILSAYPTEWVANSEFRQQLMPIIDSLARLQVYRSGGESLGGYPNLVDSPYKDELVRVISTLLALKEGEINLGSVNLATYQPAPKDFIMVTMNPGWATSLANSLPSGLVDPNGPGFLRRHTASHVGYSTVGTEEGVYLNALFGVEPPLSEYPPFPEISVYGTLTLYYIRLPLLILMREAGEANGVRLDWDHRNFYHEPFASLFSNPDIYNSLTAFDPERSPIKPPYSWQAILQQQEWLRFGVDEIVEIDFDGFK